MNRGGEWTKLTSEGRALRDEANAGFDSPPPPPNPVVSGLTTVTEPAILLGVIDYRPSPPEGGVFTVSKLDEEADRILEEAGMLNLEHGILRHPDNRQKKEQLTGDEELLDYLGGSRPDTRSTRQKTEITTKTYRGFSVRQVFSSDPVRGRDE